MPRNSSSIKSIGFSMTYRKTIINIILLGFLSGLYAVTFGLRLDLVGVTFFIVAAQLIVFLSIIAVGNVSLFLIYFIFSLVFLNLLPWLHYTEGIVIWRASPLRPETYLQVNFLLFSSNIIVFLCYVWMGKLSRTRKPKRQFHVHEGVLGYILIFVSSLALFSLLALNDYSLFALFFRGVIDEVRGNVIDSSAITLLVTMCARMIPFFCFVYSITSLGGQVLLKWILFLILIVAVFPTGVPRYMIGFVYIPLALIYFPRLRSGRLFMLLLISAIIIVFPFLDQFREFSGFDSLRLVPSINYFYAAHFDAFENMSSAIESEFVSYGWQVLGVFLFFVPRVMWEMKPIGSGQAMADNLGYEFNNISMPFLGEGFINFGYLGFFAFAVLIGYIMARIDGYFTGYANSKIRIDFSVAFYFYLVGAIFFVMRGDLLSSAAYLSSGIFVAFVLSFSVRTFQRIRFL